MTYLLDTHALLWWLFDDPRLSRTARDLIADPANPVYVSSASAWEIATKHRLGRLPSAVQLVRDMPRWLQQARLRELAITVAHAQRAGSWPQPHRDPFDRMIAAQSAIEGFPTLTRDPALAHFGIQVVW
jgi:PIN domain nuclease of toxin-antitoxin system